ncbi:P-loop containing nucleoside triphosphate hydrolase protein [Aspergillus taichungensis]|uniref:P-loop containing nucleoside triphosphate hydrolase protein n=1 Tax=Aspergillus taichungensis TaxID=482145 RepID=A0A2J5I5H6_9EURO|nr:P-loop containing nucleoside triphosphate hydrolase protein [Aspergillus taichungensis]
MVSCPICANSVPSLKINDHIDSGCQSFVEESSPPSTAPSTDPEPSQKPQVPSFFQPTSARKASAQSKLQAEAQADASPLRNASRKRPMTQDATSTSPADVERSETPKDAPVKKPRINALQQAAPLAERMRPRTLDEVCGQDLVGPHGILRGLIESDRVPSMVLWGGPGTGKTTIARVIASMVGSRFVEINSTSTGVAECKKIFGEARSELGLTGRKTIIFCDEIHRFSKSQQDVFLGPVESGQVTLIGATTENPSFKVQSALLSRCRTFTLSKLTDADVKSILERALRVEGPSYAPSALVDDELIQYLANFSDGDARTSLNLLELAMDLSRRPGISKEELKRSLTKTLVYDRAGDQHYDTISAFHKSIRGSDPDAALYYLARMIQSGEDPLYIARRLIVVASEDIGLADHSMLTLAVSTHSAVEKIGLPEARINLAHATVAMALSKKSTRAYRGLNNAFGALAEPGVAGLPIPIHLRNAPTRLMKELGYGKEYKYNPQYLDGQVAQEYLPEDLQGRRFLEDLDLGSRIDPDLGQLVVDYRGWDTPYSILQRPRDSRQRQRLTALRVASKQSNPPSSASIHHSQAVQTKQPQTTHTMATQPGFHQSYAGPVSGPGTGRGLSSNRLPDRSLNANAATAPFASSTFGRGRMMTSTIDYADQNAGPKSSQQATSAPALHTQSAPAAAAENPLSRLTEEQREEINEAFTLFDLDRDRHLDYHELRVSFRALGFTLPKQELIALLKTYGVPRPQVQQAQSQSGGAGAAKPLSTAADASHPSNLLMPLSEFQAVTAHKILERDPRDEIMRAFELFDEGGKGFIDIEDLRRVARELGETGLEEDELRAMIEEFDLEGSGGVSREAFVGICWQ